MGDWKHPKGKPYYYNSHHGRWMRRPRRSSKPSPQAGLDWAERRRLAAEEALADRTRIHDEQRELTRAAQERAAAHRGFGGRELKRAAQESARLLRLAERDMNAAADRLMAAEADLQEAEQAYESHGRLEAARANRREETARSRAIERRSESLDEAIRTARALHWIDVERFDAYVRLRERS